MVKINGCLTCFPNGQNLEFTGGISAFCLDKTCTRASPAMARNGPGLCASGLVMKTDGLRLLMGASQRPSWSEAPTCFGQNFAPESAGSRRKKTVGGGWCSITARQPTTPGVAWLNEGVVLSTSHPPWFRARPPWLHPSPPPELAAPHQTGSGAGKLRPPALSHT